MYQYFAVGAVGFASLLGLYVYTKTRQNVLTTEVIQSSESQLAFEKISQKKFYDATAVLSKNTVIYPGDPSLEIESICKLGHDGCFGLSKISMSNHMGTHIDFPSHVIPGGKSSSAYSLDRLSGKGLIIAVPDNKRTVSKDLILNENISKESIVFFKTANRKLSKSEPLSEKYVYIDPEAALLLVEKGVSIVGIDYISVDSISDGSLTTHNTLLKNEVLIVENLELDGIEPGKCHVQIAPLNINDMDGLPARVIITR